MGPGAGVPDGTAHHVMHGMADRAGDNRGGGFGDGVARTEHGKPQQFKCGITTH